MKAPIEMIRQALQVALHQADKRRTVWKGVYERFSDVPEAGAGHDSDSWIDAVREDAKRFVARGGHDSTFWGSKLSTIATLVAKRPLTILDFGGGLGTACVHLERTLRVPGELAYHVVEGKRVCDEGRQLKLSGAITYHEALPKLDGVDILFARSSMQYIDEWRDLLGTLAAYRAQYMLFEDLPAGNVPTFATAQLNIAGSAIPYRFYNRDEFVQALEQNGYALRLDEATTRTVEPRDFPESHRIGTTRDLLFERTR